MWFIRLSRRAPSASISTLSNIINALKSKAWKMRKILPWLICTSAAVVKRCTSTRSWLRDPESKTMRIRSSLRNMMTTSFSRVVSELSKRTAALKNHLLNRDLVMSWYHPWSPSRRKRCSRTLIYSTTLSGSSTSTMKIWRIKSCLHFSGLGPANLKGHLSSQRKTHNFLCTKHIF